MMNPINPLSYAAISWANISELWALKSSIATFVAGACAIIGADAVLIWLLLLAMCLDFTLGVSDAIHRRHFRCRTLERGALKLVYYSAYLGVVSLVNASLSRACGMELPLLNLFTAYLTLTEAVSITAHMQSLGWPVPALLLRVVCGSRKHIEKRVDTVLPEEGNPECNEIKDEKR